MNTTSKLGLTLVAAALVALYGCGKEEPKKAEAPKAPAAPVEEVVVVKIGHAGPLTGGIAHLGKDDENGVRLAVDEANAKKIKIGGKTVKFELLTEDDQADPKIGPDDRAEVRRRQGRRRRRPPELRRDDPRLGRLQPGRHPDDLRLGDQPEADRAGLQDRLPHRRPRRPAGSRRRRVPRERAQGEEGRDRRRRHRLRRGPRQRSREDAEGRRRDRSSRARRPTTRRPTSRRS